MKKQKEYSANFKSEVVREILRKEKSLSQISSQYKVHPTQLNRWKSIVLKGMASLFEKGKEQAEERKEQEQKQAELYEEIGRLTTQLSWLKKKSGFRIE
ncbi:MAG: transposase [Blastocatellia bacterium]